MVEYRTYQELYMGPCGIHYKGFIIQDIGSPEKNQTLRTRDELVAVIAKSLKMGDSVQDLGEITMQFDRRGGFGGSRNKARILGPINEDLENTIYFEIAKKWIAQQKGVLDFGAIPR